MFLQKIFGYGKKDLTVVPRKTYYPSIEGATNDQRNFYFYRLQKLKQGEYIELGENLSYLYCYAYQLFIPFMNDKNIGKLEKEIWPLLSLYGNTSAGSYIEFRLSDAYILVGEYQKARDTLIKHNFPDIETFLFFLGSGANVRITGKIIVNMMKFGFTKYGKENIDGIAQTLDVFLRDFEIEHGIGLVEFFAQDLQKRPFTEQDLLKYREFFSSEKQFLELKKYDEQSKRNKTPHSDYLHYYQKTLFAGIATVHYFEVKTKIIVPGSTITSAFTNSISVKARECENIYREECGIPKIGEGWISETELFYRLKQYFSNEKVLHHGRPEWLGKQHLDIYFPERNIGIEYQGKQHQEPVAYFGGEESFKKQILRDKQKQSKCRKNKCKLIYVYEGYIFDEVVKEILLVKKKS